METPKDQEGPKVDAEKKEDFIAFNISAETSLQMQNITMSESRHFWIIDGGSKWHVTNRKENLIDPYVPQKPSDIRCW